MTDQLFAKLKENNTNSISLRNNINSIEELHDGVMLKPYKLQLLPLTSRKLASKWNLEDWGRGKANHQSQAG